jgi:L-threonylcarbamoyladenylate synthase
MISSSIDAAVSLLRNGQVVAFPTETVYGLGAIAFEPRAIAQIFEIKGRPRFDPLIVHAENAQKAFELCANTPLVAIRLAEAFWPGPLTLVLPKRPSIPDIVTAGLASVAVRVPAHPVALQLLAAIEAPLAAPSANRFGRASPTTSTHVQDDLGSAVELILEGGPCERGIESTILSLLYERPRLLRPGGISLEAIQALIGDVDATVAVTTRPQSPGQLSSHYAPSTRMEPFREEPQPAAEERVGLLAIAKSRPGFAAVEILSSQGDLREAASNLFAALRRLDCQRLDRILCEFAPAHGLGLAINDRLWRGCQRHPTEPKVRPPSD